MLRTPPRVHELDRASPLPLWAQLTDDLMARIGTAGFTESFPSEHQLVAEYGVSRHTVREALRRLRDDGLLDSARGRGTWVRAGRLEQPLGALYSLFRAVEARGLEQRSVVRVLDTRRDLAAARRLRLDDDAELVYLERLRLAGGEPLALDHVWLPREVGRGVLTADLSHTGLYDVLSEFGHHRPTGGVESLRAVVPAPEVRRALGLRAGVAVFEIERLGKLEELPIELRHTVVRGDRFSVTADWSARHGYRLGVSGDLPATEGAATEGAATDAPAGHGGGA